MTYLHQLRAHFTGKQLQIEQIGPTSDESSYVIGNYKSDNLSSQNLLNLSHLKAQLLHQNSLDDDIFGLDNNKSQLSPTAKKDVKNLILSGSKSILGKVLSPTKDKNSINASQHSNLNASTTPTSTPTSALIEGNGSLEDQQQHADEVVSNSSNQENISQNAQLKENIISPTALDPNTTNKILSRHKEQSEKARQMMEKLRISQNERLANDEERQQRLREEARRIILETRGKSSSNHSSLESPTSPTKNKRYNFTSERTISPISNTLDLDDFTVGGGGGESATQQHQSSPKAPLSPTKRITPPRDNDSSSNTTTTTATTNSKLSPSHRLSLTNGGGGTTLQSFNNVMDRLTPKSENMPEKLAFIQSELEALEREQVAVDQKANSLEKKLRAVMSGKPITEETEEQLLSQWFTLVNKKNALIRRQMQLNLHEKECELEHKYNLLKEELRAAQSIEDWRKTEAQREKERLLLDKLVDVVDKRNELVQCLHNEEQAIEDDHEIARNLEQVNISGNNEKCVIS
uniref:BMERB domain-containing protein n=1 Tax=Musca domestica TaxID=7370 RepID=T1PK42_MUSDO